MNQILLKKLSLCAIIFSVLAVGEVFAQQATPTPAKRNSPFAPNPKKKVEPTTISQNEPPTKSEPNSEVKIVNIEATTQPIETPTPQVEETKTNPPETNTSEEFESRSVAKKTLEVAKRASAIEASPTETYKVGIGDILFISLQNAPAKETTYFTVLNNGNIDYPLAGEMMQVLGLTIEQIEELLEGKIKLYESPQVSKFGSIIRIFLRF